MQYRFSLNLSVRLAGLILLLSAIAADAAELVMFEAAGCAWCARWNEEIGGIYARTEEGRELPLRRVDLFDERPPDLKDVQDIVYTPTFVLLENGREVGRITGYLGEDQFWGLLGMLRAEWKRTRSDAKP